MWIVFVVSGHVVGQSLPKNEVLSSSFLRLSLGISSFLTSCLGFESSFVSFSLGFSYFCTELLDLVALASDCFGVKSASTLVCFCFPLDRANGLCVGL